MKSSVPLFYLFFAFFYPHTINRDDIVLSAKILFFFKYFIPFPLNKQNIKNHSLSLVSLKAL